MKRIVIITSILLFIFSTGLFAQQQTSDGGFIIAGATYSYGSGQDDFLVYKLDAAGQKLWRKYLGGQFSDRASQIKQTSDGGYIVAGRTISYGMPYLSTTDFLIYKLAANGAKQWRKNYGGGWYDDAFGVIQTSDGGYLVSGDSTNYNQTTPNNEYDFLIYKLAADGSKQWRKNYGGILYDRGLRAVQTSDGGYAMVGYSDSYTNGGYDVLIYKLSASGIQQWRKNFGGSGNDYGLFIRQTTDGGYIVCGKTESYIHTPAPGETKLGAPPADILVYKLDASGKKLWRKNYGGIDMEDGGDIRHTPDGGYIFCGTTDSYTHGGHDMVVYKVNAAGAKQWRKYYGGSGDDSGRYIVPCSDGGYLLFGQTLSYTNGCNDFLVYRLNASGANLWRKNYGGDLDETIDMAGAFY